ncbi:MAG: DUF87 domain-containing protein [Verrucomicrobia bacterium]|nr:DUF87 domain-containing protein [Verrucomicrobiota bacterium]MDA1088339.1 DUF87 domain-containing protein [Verrucomicrobiota bacterium]
MQDFEKLGAFYLGKAFDPDAGAVKEELILYDAKDLTTHAICVGMTGSGKTGLCVSLLEEAALDGIPAIVIDPKGDLGNLMLNFPSLRPEDFRPWIDESEAMRKGYDVETYATKTAEMWKSGLAEWGQGPQRLAALRAAADVAIYTPGSQAGLPISVIKSFAAPPPELLNDSDAVRDRIQASVSGLLALLGIDADPLQSREHILLSNILLHHWQKGKSLGLADLIREIQAPPFTVLGVFDLETFYPGKERMTLAMRLNNALASPGFSAWMEGDPLDCQRLLYTPEGKPRVSILSIAHLSESERMFFVTVLLNEVVSWMRTQPGTSSLRAILYMDEIFGYFPPTANPPSKLPMLTLLKQARAYGLGCVLATQNPVDLDYKGLANTGTWFIGRLQAERDKMRLLDGLEGATASAGQTFDRARIETILSGLGSRVFLMNNVHDDEPVLFHTRWAMSYLRGPLTRTQIERLMASRKRVAAAAAVPVTTAPVPMVQQAAAAAPGPAPEPQRPTLPSSVKQCHLPLNKDLATGRRLVYRPGLLATVRLHFVRASVKVDDWVTLAVLGAVPGDDEAPAWDEATVFDGDPPAVRRSGAGDATYSELAGAATRAKSYTSWGKALKEHLYQNREITIWTCKALKAVSELGESEGDFRVRLRQLAHEKRDTELEKLRRRHAPKLKTIEDRIRRAEAKVDVEQSQYSSGKTQTAISIGATVLGALFGRKVASVGTLGRASTTMNRASRTARQRGDIQRAQESVEALTARLEEMGVSFQDDLDALKERYNPEILDLEQTQVRPRKSDLSVKSVQLAWTPWQIDADGIAEPLF